MLEAITVADRRVDIAGTVVMPPSHLTLANSSPTQTGVGHQ